MYEVALENGLIIILSIHGLFGGVLLAGLSASVVYRTIASRSQCQCCV